MIGLVIAAHGRLAREMVATAEQMVGPLQACEPVEIAPGTSPEAVAARLREAVGHVDGGAGVLVLTDLLGGTPCNQCLGLCSELHLEVLSGVNLPMLLKANSLRDAGGSLAALAESLAAYGQKHITHATALLRAATSPDR
ncbi:MAG: PTS mannose transporter subunit IID [Deltaproteobacteria bacterium]|nr:PTS mannose transporter subunit IID [Deltaproteobacteria bacterium]